MPPQGRTRRRPTVGPPRPAIPLLPAVRIRAAPALEPPFDDELPPHLPGQPVDQLALNLRIASVPAIGPASGCPDEPPARRPAGASAECWQAARRFTGICLEILNGYRPIRHLRPLASQAKAGEVVRQLERAQERATELALQAGAPGRGRAATQVRPPDRSGLSAAPAPRLGAGRPMVGPDSRSTARQRAGPPRGQPRKREPVRLARLYVSEPRPEVAEAVAVLTIAGRSWALALRLERHRDRWLCTTARTV